MCTAIYYRRHLEEAVAASSGWPHNATFKVTYRKRYAGFNRRELMKPAPVEFFATEEDLAVWISAQKDWAKKGNSIHGYVEKWEDAPVLHSEFDF